VGILLMIDRQTLSESLSGPENCVLDDLPRLLSTLSQSETLDLLDLMEDSDLFRNRLPMRLRIYASIAENAPEPIVRLIALVRLLRRIGARKDLPNLGDVPGTLADFEVYLPAASKKFIGDCPITDAIVALASATLAFRSGDIPAMRESTAKGLDALDRIPSWLNPPDGIGLIDILIAEVGHELMFIASNTAFRSGNVEKARVLAENWSRLINKWEKALGPLDRVRYQYYQLSGHINYDVGLPSEALKAYTLALTYAPTSYRKAFLWMSMAQVERELGLFDESWEHGIAAVEAWLQSPYPQTAGTWIEWLSLEARTSDKRSLIELLRERSKHAGGVEINRVSGAMTELYRILADLRYGADPSKLAPRLDSIICDLESAESWPNLVTLLATRAVLAGRINDRETMNMSIEKARGIISTKLTADSRPPAEFFLESAHALALRDVGAYDEAFTTLFERAMEARAKYPGGVGPNEQSTLEALYYLGALAGHDPAGIEKRVRATLSETA
jgi:tetratricopeptide (TPR) repeat protein